MHYCLLIETNHKEKEVFIHYLQADGNEDALLYLYQLVIESSDGQFAIRHGDVSTFEMGDPRKRITQEAVDQHLQFADLGCFDQRFDVLNGILEFPFNYEDTDCMDSKELAILLDDHFYAGKIQNYFKTK